VADVRVCGSGPLTVGDAAVTPGVREAVRITAGH
jgi:hypothetical protein